MVWGGSRESSACRLRSSSDSSMMPQHRVWGGRAFHCCWESMAVSGRRCSAQQVHLQMVCSCPSISVSQYRHWAEVSGDSGLDTADLGVVAPGEVVVKQAQLPGAELERPARAGQPSGSKHVDALSDPRKAAEVISRLFDLAEESTALRRAQHVQEAALRDVEPANAGTQSSSSTPNDGQVQLSWLSVWTRRPTGPPPCPCWTASRSWVALAQSSGSRLTWRGSETRVSRCVMASSLRACPGTQTAMRLRKLTQLLPLGRMAASRACL